MIWESAIWKEELFKTAQRLSRRRTQRRWSERSLMLVEKDVFIGFYAVRKLLEARKLSEGFRRIRIPVDRYPSVGKPVTYMNYHRVEQLYDIDPARRQDAAMSVIDLCNRVVHSYVFFSGFDDRNGLSFLLFCSDRDRNAYVYVTEVAEVIALLEAVAFDDIHEMVLHWDEQQQDQRVIRATNRGLKEDGSGAAAEYISSRLSTG